MFNQGLNSSCSEADILGVISCSHEFDGIKVREEEIRSLKSLVNEGYMVCQTKVHHLQFMTVISFRMA